MGAPRKPTRVKILQGTFRKDRNKPEPQYKTPAKVPPPPDYLSEDAKAHWRGLAPMLHKAGVLTEVDLNALAMLCATWARIQSIETKLAEDGPVIVGTKGHHVRHPLAPELHQQQALFVRLLTEFGLTPASRGRVSFKGETEGDNRFLYGAF